VVSFGVGGKSREQEIDLGWFDSLSAFCAERNVNLHSATQNSLAGSSLESDAHSYLIRHFLPIWVHKGAGLHNHKSYINIIII